MCSERTFCAIPDCQCTANSPPLCPPCLCYHQAYIMRAHIVAGTPESSSSDVEYAWLTREEMEQRIVKPLWSDVRDLLSA